MKFKFTEEIPAIKEPSPKIDDALVNEEVLKLVRTLKLVQIGLKHELSIEVEKIQPTKIERLNPPLAPIIKKRKWTIRLPKGKGMLHAEMHNNSLFEKRRLLCENYKETRELQLSEIMVI